MNKGIIKYKLYDYIKSGKSIVPIVIFIIWLGMAYSVGPVDILGSFGLCSIVIFVAMVAIGISFANQYNPMIEMSYLVRIKDKKQLYLSNLIIMCIFSGILTLIGIVIPMVFYVTGGFTLYSRSVRISDILVGGLVMLLAAICGGICGQFANSRMIKNHRKAVITGIFLTVLTLVKVGLVENSPLLEYPLIFLPPINELAKSITDMDVFLLTHSFIGYLIWMVSFIIIINFLYLKIMLLRKME